MRLFTVVFPFLLRGIFSISVGHEHNATNIVGIDYAGNVQSRAGARAVMRSRKSKNTARRATTAKTLTIHLHAGWNWFSLNVIADDMSVNSILGSLTNLENGDMLKNRFSFTTYVKHGTYRLWFGGLRTLDVKESYMIKLQKAGTLVVTGRPVDVASTTLSLIPGWNWIPSIYQTSFPVKKALTDSACQWSSGDSLKSQVSFTSYVPGHGWFGGLTDLEPGKGYRIKVANACSLKLPEPEPKLCPGEASRSECTTATTSTCDSWRVEGLTAERQPKYSSCECTCRRMRPHIVMLLIDDMGYNDFFGSEDMGPAWTYVNSMLSSAIHINSSYGEPVCAPSRASFLSGRFRYYLQDPYNVPGSAWGAFSSTYEISLPMKLAKSGYKSYAIGKWHAGSISWQMSPTGRGFSRYYGNYENGDHYWHCTNYNYFGFNGDNAHPGVYDLSYEESEPFESESSTVERPFHRIDGDSSGSCCSLDSYKTTIYDRKAEEFMRDHKNKYQDQGQHVPFFLYYAQYSFHGPMQAPDHYTAKCGEGDFASYRNEHRKTLCGMAYSLDDSIKKMTHIVTELFPEDTYVLLVNTDNGGPAWDPDGSEGQNNLPLRGNKGESWEGGTRSHALLAGTHQDLQAAAAKGKTYTGGMMHFADWHATLAQVGHATDKSKCQGREERTCGVSMWNALTSKSQSDFPSPRIEFISNERAKVIRKMCPEQGSWAGCTKGNWKLILGKGEGHPKHARGLHANGRIHGNYWPLKDISQAEYHQKYYESSSPHFSPPTDLTYVDDVPYLFNLDENPQEDIDQNKAREYPNMVRYLTDRYNHYSQGTRSNGEDNYVCAGGGSSCVNSKKQADYDWNQRKWVNFVDSNPNKARLVDADTKRYKALNRKATETFDPISSNPCGAKNIVHYPWWQDADEF